MKVGIDCRLWNQTGVGRYIRNLVMNLSPIDKINEYVLFVRSQDIKSLKLEIGPLDSGWKLQIADFPWHSISEQIGFAKVLNKENLDLVHFPYFSVPIFYNKPFIVTIHDLIVNRFSTGRASTLPFPLYFAKRIGYHAVLSSIVYRSKKIIVPSNAVRRDLLRTYPRINSGKVEVTYEGGFDGHIKNKKLNVKNDGKLAEGRYLLRVGNFYPHKNVEGLLLAFNEFLYDSYQNHDVKLILVGKRDYFLKRIERKVEKLNISANVIFFENVSDSGLANLYQNAIATVVPSYAEGFSLTAVEAMSVGCPVIASDIPIHREICGNAAVYCNPFDTNDIKQKIDFVYSFTDLSKKELVEQGKRQAKKFSWKKMSEQTLHIYQNA